MDNFIYIKKKAIKKIHCDNIVKILNSQKLYVGDHPIVKKFYKGIFGILVEEQEWFNDFLKHVENYKKLHPFLGKGNVGFWKVDVFCNYQKYKKNNFYKKEHCEHGPEYSKRVLAWMFYCNTIKNGGGTKFPQQNFIAKPEAGTLLIWPAGWTHSHIGIAALNEEKYIATGWFSYI